MTLDLRFTDVERIMLAGVRQRHFPGAALVVTHRQKTAFELAVGRYTYEPDSMPVTLATIYDLASLTKVIATTSMAMLLHERQRLDLDCPLAQWLPEFQSPDDPRRALVTVRMLLAHSSGLPAYVRLFEEQTTRDGILRAACAVPLEADPLTRSEYSDVGFILLGAVLERLADEPIDRFCRREIFDPLGMKETVFHPPADWKLRIPPTLEALDFRKRTLQGEVNDENAFVMGGVAGHAGLFAPATDVARFAECMLREGSPVFQPATVGLFTTRTQKPVWTSRALGWDTPSQPSQSGKYFSSRAFGHLGYTGTSLWIEPDRELSVTLLSNRTWPDRSSREIKHTRPMVHDAIVEALGNA